MLWFMVAVGVVLVGEGGDVVVVDVDVVVSPVSLEEKVAAVLLCFASGGMFTVKSVRECACAYVAIGDKMAGRIVKFLAELGLVKYDSRERRWVATDKMPRLGSFDEALKLAFDLSSRYSRVLVYLKSF